MASRYTAEALLQLRQSPLCVKPPNLPPAEQWMGPAPDNVRTQQPRPGTDRPKPNDGTFTLDQANRRSVGDRNTSRSLSNSEDIVLGPPKLSFASASSLRNIGAKVGTDADKTFRDQEPRDRFGLRTRSEQADPTVFPGSGTYGTSSSRDTRNPNYRRRGDADQDSDGWSTVKPRKSFGHEGAERFHSRVGNAGSGGGGVSVSGSGGAGDRFGRDDRKPRDRDDNDVTGRDRPRRTFDRDVGDDNNEGTRRNGLATRGPWFKDNNNGANDDRSERPNHTDRNDRSLQRERIDRTKNWRERDPENQQNENFRDRNNDRGGGGFDRRWDRDRDYFQQQRVERDPEWMDEDVSFAEEVPAGGHTEEDLRRFMEDMKGRGPEGLKQAEPPASGEGPGKKAWRTEPTSTPIEPGPDRFFEQFSKATKADENNVADFGDAAAVRAKSGKLSRFTSFFSSQEDTRRQTEPPTPATGVPPQPPPNGGLLAALQPPDAAEKEAFQALLQKLQRQTLHGGGGSAGSATSPDATGSIGIGRPPGASNGNPPGTGDFKESPGSAILPAHREARQRSGVASPDPPFPHPGLDRREDPRFRGSMPQVPSQQIMQDLLLQRQPPMASVGQSPPSTVRPEQMIQELLLQRQQATSQDSGVPRMGLGTGPGGPGPNMAATNSQTEFLMKLMQSRSGPDSRRPDELLMRMPQPQKQVNIPAVPDREAEMVEFTRERDRLGLQRQQMRPPQGLPGLFSDEQFHRQEVENRPPPQPTQILQRPPPPGLEHTMHGPLPPFLQQGAGGAGGRMPPQQVPPQQGPQQPMIPPPPGLGVNHPSNPQNRTMPNIPNMLNMPPNMPLSLPLNMPSSMLNLPNLTNMPMPNLPNMFPPNFSPSGPFPPDGILSGPPRNIPPPPPGFFNGPPGPPGFMPPPGMGFQNIPPDGVPFPFNDGRGMPPPPHGVGFRRS